MVALPLGVVMALIVYLLEVMVPWKNELSAPNNNDASLVALRSWLPSISGESQHLFIMQNKSFGYGVMF